MEEERTAGAGGGGGRGGGPAVGGRGDGGGHGAGARARRAGQGPTGGRGGAASAARAGTRVAPFRSRVEGFSRTEGHEMLEHVSSGPPARACRPSRGAVGGREATVARAREGLTGASGGRRAGWRALAGGVGLAA